MLQFLLFFLYFFLLTSILMLLVLGMTFDRTTVYIVSLIYDL
jgi:hypothetical protein